MLQVFDSLTVIYKYGTAHKQIVTNIYTIQLMCLNDSIHRYNIKTCMINKRTDTYSTLMHTDKAISLYGSIGFYFFLLRWNENIKALNFNFKAFN